MIGVGVDSKQLLNEVEHDIENDQGRGLCYDKYIFVLCMNDNKYSSKIPLNCFVTLFVLMVSFSDSKVEISSVFNDVNRLKVILFTFKKYSVLAGFLASCRPCWGLGFDSVQ